VDSASGVRRKHLPESDGRSSVPASAEETPGACPCRCGAGEPPPAPAVAGIRELFDLDIATHRARLFGRHLQAYRILPVDRWTTDQVHALGVSDPVEMLGDFVGTGEEVEDPYGGATEGYRRSLRQLDRLVDAAIDRLESAVAP